MADINNQTRAGSSVLVLSVHGSPISFEQVEEHSYRMKDDVTIVDTHKTKTYRDFFGRIRTENLISKGPSSVHIIQFIDRIEGWHTILMSNNTEKVGYRLPLSKASGVKFAIFPLAEQDDGSVQRRWTTIQEDIGSRIIENIEFNGTKIITSTEDEPRVTKTVEQWYSVDFKLIGLIRATSFSQIYTAQIQNVKCDEPDPALFVVPSDYNIVDQLPPSE